MMLVILLGLLGHELCILLVEMVEKCPLRCEVVKLLVMLLLCASKDKHVINMAECAFLTFQDAVYLFIKQVIRVQKLVGLPPPALELLGRLS